MAIDDKTRAEILRLHYAEKWKIGTIAEALEVHDSTIDRVLAAAGVPREERRRRRSKFDPFLPFNRDGADLLATQQIQIRHCDASPQAPCQGEESAAKTDSMEVWGPDTAYVACGRVVDPMVLCQRCP